MRQAWLGCPALAGRGLQHFRGRRRGRGGGRGAGPHPPLPPAAGAAALVLGLEALAPSRVVVADGNDDDSPTRISCRVHEGRLPGRRFPG